MSDRAFRLRVAGLVALGLAVRLTYAYFSDMPLGPGDDHWYHNSANLIADGRGFSDPFLSQGPDGREFGTSGEPIPTAFHLPLFSALLSVGSLLGATSYEAHQVMGCAFGAATVGVIAFVGRGLGGERAALLAAGIAAVYLPMVANDALLLSESLYGLTVACVLLAAVRYRAAPAARGAVLLGLAIGLAALTRTEALLFYVFLAPLVWRARGRRGRDLAIVGLATLVCIVPWSVRNTLTFDEPVLLTTGDGSVFGGANLPSTYSGRLIGGWHAIGLFRSPVGRNPSTNEAVQSRRWRKEGLEYARDHAERLPVVISVRVLRTWSIFPFNPVDKARFASDNYKHIRLLEYPSQLIFAAVLVLALGGFLAARRRGDIPLSIFVAPVVLVTIVSVLGYGDPRFRQAADVALVLFAALGAERLLASRREPRTAA